jgi:hypothetical protein
MSDSLHEASLATLSGFVSASGLPLREGMFHFTRGDVGVESAHTRTESGTEDLLDFGVAVYDFQPGRRREEGVGCFDSAGHLHRRSEDDARNPFTARGDQEGGPDWDATTVDGGDDLVDLFLEFTSEELEVILVDSPVEMEETVRWGYERVLGDIEDVATQYPDLRMRGECGLQGSGNWWRGINEIQPHTILNSALRTSIELLARDGGEGRLMHWSGWSSH